MPFLILYLLHPFFLTFRLLKMWSSLSIKLWSLWKRGLLDSMKNYTESPKILRNMTKMEEEPRMIVALPHHHLQGEWFEELMTPSWMGVSAIAAYWGGRSTARNLVMQVERVEVRAVVIKVLEATRLEAVGGLLKSSQWLGNSLWVGGIIFYMLRLAFQTCLAHESSGWIFLGPQSKSWYSCAITIRGLSVFV